jgi:hypothetical protein
MLQSVVFTVKTGEWEGSRFHTKMALATVFFSFHILTVAPSREMHKKLMNNNEFELLL